MLAYQNPEHPSYHGRKGMYALDIGFKSRHLGRDRPALNHGEVSHG